MTSPTIPPPHAAPPPGAAGVTRPNEIKLVSHSNLFYWWPVWALAFFMAAWTYSENHRLAILPPNGEVSVLPDGSYRFSFPGEAPTGGLLRAIDQTKANADLRASGGAPTAAFKARISSHPAFGAVFVIGLVLTIVITNVPLRGLWSFIAIILIVVIALFVSLFKVWDEIFEAIGSLHIHINMAGYLFIGSAVFVLWALATFVFDQRTYIIFTPGQIRVCEHIGASVQAFGTMGVALEKQRDDLFRHYILGFGSGDLIAHLPGGREIKMPNVLGIGWRLRPVEEMLRMFTTSS